MKPGDVTNMDVLLPPVPVRERFRERAKPLLQRLFQNDSNSTALAALRDALLPRLLSGELRLNDAERAVGEVA